jgi:hypothetical protein
MGTFGSGVFGGGGGGSVPVTSGVPIKNLFYMALRLAHVTKVAQVGPSPDQFADCLLACQLMISTANIQRGMILTRTITAYPLGTKKIYTLGLNGTLGTTYPLYIDAANLIMASTGTPVHLNIFRGSFREWSQLAVQDIPGSLPRQLYCDYNHPTANIYLVPQDQGGDQLELYTWAALPVPLTTSDMIAFAPGYDDWFVNNLAVRLSSIFAEQGAYITDDTRLEARRTEMAVKSRNSAAPRMSSDVPRNQGTVNRGDFNWFDGMPV